MGDNRELRTAIEAAIDSCIQEGILVDFFEKRREEVVKAMELEMIFERQKELEYLEEMKREKESEE